MTARQWVQYSFSVDVSDATSTPVEMLSYDPNLSRVRINLGATLMAVTSQITPASGNLTSPGSFADNHVSVPPGATSLLATVTPAAGLDVEVVVWDPSGTQVGIIDAGGAGVAEQVSVTDPIPGSYQVRVLSQAGTGTWSMAGSITISSTPPPGSTWRVERSTDLVRWKTVRGGDNIPIPES